MSQPLPPLEDDLDKKGSKEAAIFRALPRAMRGFSRIQAGSLPRVPTKTIAKAADKLSKVVDVKDSA